MVLVVVGAPEDTCINQSIRLSLHSCSNKNKINQPTQLSYSCTLYKQIKLLLIQVMIVVTKIHFEIDTYLNQIFFFFRYNFWFLWRNFSKLLQMFVFFGRMAQILRKAKSSVKFDLKEGSSWCRIKKKIKKDIGSRLLLPLLPLLLNAACLVILWLWYHSWTSPLVGDLIGQSAINFSEMIFFFVC